MKILNLKRVEKFLKNPIFKGFILLLFFSFTFIIRVHNYDKTPAMGHLEELMYVWSGMHLIEDKVPIAWSSLDYPKSAEVYKGKIQDSGGQVSVFVTLYKPWLDQPPLFSLIVGESARLFHANSMEIMSPAFIRIPSLLFATLTAVLIFLIARKVDNFWTGVLAMLIYGTVPILVFASRLAVAENFIAFLFTLTVYLLIKFEETAKFRYLIVIPFLAGMAGLSKATGFFILPLAVYFTFFKKFYKSIIYLILLTVPFIGIFFAYGLHFDPALFWRINSIQSQRPVGFNSLGWILSSPAYDINIFTDSWYIFCLICSIAFLFFLKDRRLKLISLVFVYWLLVVMFSGGEGDLLPWYRFPAFPFLAIFGALGVKYLIEKADFFSSFLISGLLLGGTSLLVNPFRPSIAPNNYRVLTAVFLTPSLVNMVYEKLWLHKLTQILLILIVAAGLYLNTLYIYNQFELRCESKSCPMAASTSLAQIHFPLIWRFFVLSDK